MKIYIAKSKTEITSFLSKLISKSESIGLSGGSLTNLVPIDSSCAQKHFYFSDERLVKLNDPDSNYNGYAEKFKAAGCVSVNTIDDSLLSNPEALVLDYKTKLKSLGSLMKFDLMLLGMGPDGHTASLFPSHLLLKSKGTVEYISDSPKPPSERITLTLEVLNQSKTTVFVVLGKSKAKIVHEIFDEGVVYPAGMVTGNVIWILDEDSSAELERETEPLPVI